MQEPENSEETSWLLSYFSLTPAPKPRNACTRMCSQATARRTSCIATCVGTSGPSQISRYKLCPTGPPTGASAGSQYTLFQPAGCVSSTPLSAARIFLRPWPARLWPLGGPLASRTNTQLSVHRKGSHSRHSDLRVRRSSQTNRAALLSPPPPESAAAKGESAAAKATVPIFERAPRSRYDSRRRFRPRRSIAGRYRRSRDRERRPLRSRSLRSRSRRRSLR